MKEAKTHCTLPVFLGSGISEHNIGEFYGEADGFIIGSAFQSGWTVVQHHRPSARDEIRERSQQAVRPERGAATEGRPYKTSTFC